MKRISQLLLVLIAITGGCSERKFIVTEVAFASTTENVDILGISGLDMGPMYSSQSYTPKNVGKVSYISYDTINVEDELLIRWRSSAAEQDVVLEQVIRRPDSIPSILPGEHVLVFQHEDGKWILQMKPLPKYD
jgi:hypothetical protein